MKDLILKYNGNDYDLSCSEMILHAANEKWNLKLNDSNFKMVAPFSGGFYTEDVCGIVTACLCVLGILFTDGVAHQSSVMKDSVSEFIALFNERLSTINCKVLKKSYRDEQFGCRDIIVEGGVILEEVVNNHQLK
ncbi:C_GCAxxG_C_C family protein [Mycoplasmatota bacterium]|nr:C_GCAxxG_C_C family protein [Mycoplasmatota bacterium]